MLQARDNVMLPLIKLFLPLTNKVKHLEVALSLTLIVLLNSEPSQASTR